MSHTRGLIGAGIILLLMIATFTAGWTVATLGIGAGIRPSSLSELERQFTERMRGAAMVGWFTVAGGEDRPARPDRYTISSVQKVGDDRWRFNTMGTFTVRLFH